MAPLDDTTEVVASVSAAHDAADHDGLLARLASPDVGVVTLTVTEAGYCRDATAASTWTDPVVGADIAALRADLCRPVRSVPARLVAGLAARRRAGGGPIALVPCDNLPANGRALQRVVADLVDAVDPGLAPWLDDSVSFVTTVVDRITPRAGDADVAVVAPRDRLARPGPGGHRAVQRVGDRGLVPRLVARRGSAAGAILVDDAEPYAQRKLWLLNGGALAAGLPRLGPRPRHRGGGGRRRRLPHLAPTLVGGGRGRPAACRPSRSRPTRSSS